jgi:hypothetical protein
VKNNRSIFVRAVVLISLMASLTILSNKIQADTGNCGGVTITLPFNDVMASPFFCQIAAAYYSGLTNGTSATTFSPTQTVTREQIAAFTTRTLDQSLNRGSRRAALNQWWTTQSAANLGLTTIGNNPQYVQSDGQDLWIACGQFNPTGVVSRVRASDGKLLETWTGATGATGILVAMGRVFITGSGTGSSLYMIDPSQPAGSVTSVASGLLDFVSGIAFDGAKIWLTLPGGIYIITPGTWSVFQATTGFTEPRGIIFDGTNIWVTDFQADKLFKLDSNGNIIQSIIVGDGPVHPIFDGANIWVPNAASNSVTVVRASTGVVLATLTGNGLSSPSQAAFDGQRILVTNPSGRSVSLWKATDLTPLGFTPTGANTPPLGACSDGINFWITLSPDKLARF